MTNTAIVLLFATMMSSAAVAAPADSEIGTAIHKTIDSFNAGDMKTLKSMFALGSVTIVDEYAPHLWTGPSAYQQWLDAYGKSAQLNVETEPALTFSPPSRVQVDGKTAYAIMPTIYTWKAKGAPMVEEAQMTFVLNQTAAGWKIRAMTWTGVTPHAPTQPSR